MLDIDKQYIFDKQGEAISEFDRNFTHINAMIAGWNVRQ